MVTDLSAAGFVDPAQLYTIEALKRCLGIKDATLRAARRAGLRVSYKHGRGYILGDDWIDYVQAPAVTEESE